MLDQFIANELLFVAKDKARLSEFLTRHVASKEDAKEALNSRKKLKDGLFRTKIQEINTNLLRNLSTAPASVLTSASAFDVINDPDARVVARSLLLEGAAVVCA